MWLLGVEYDSGVWMIIVVYGQAESGEAMPHRL